MHHSAVPLRRLSVAVLRAAKGVLKSKSAAA